ncbi:MAG TPA: alpha/beta fold hydrolase [Rhodocyclaceae bacterium]|nr:alpha/beta fold hydrolase [Rhodocyclaceae bacterium]
MRLAMLMLGLVIVVTANHAASAADADQAARKPVAVIQDGLLEVMSPSGHGMLSIHLTRDWALPQPDVVRAVIFIHGWSRRDLHAGERAARKVGNDAEHAIVITPQFLIPEDVEAHQLPAEMLRWGLDDWKAGFNARGPAPISSFAAIDTIFNHLVDRKIFPNLKQVVLAGHSAGGQFVQRYALFGQGEEVLLKAGIPIRYVVANPSSYAYFDDQRPKPDGSFSQFDGAQCAKFNRWEYGLASNVPAYARRPVVPEPLEQAYLARDVIYLLGTEDKDPNHPELDRSCGGEAEGPTRFARGHSYLPICACSIAGKQPNAYSRFPASATIATTCTRLLAVWLRCSIMACALRKNPRVNEIGILIWVPNRQFETAPTQFLLLPP